MLPRNAELRRIVFVDDLVATLRIYSAFYLVKTAQRQRCETCGVFVTTKLHLPKTEKQHHCCHVCLRLAKKMLKVEAPPAKHNIKLFLWDYMTAAESQSRTVCAKKCDVCLAGSTRDLFYRHIHRTSSCIVWDVCARCNKVADNIILLSGQQLTHIICAIVAHHGLPGELARVIAGNFGKKDVCLFALFCLA